MPEIEWLGMAVQDTRKTILTLLEERGGLHKSALCRETGRGWGTIGHHLAVLEALGLVETETHGPKVWAFDPELPLADRDLVVALADPGRQRVLEHLNHREPATVRELSAELDASQKVVRTHLSHLMNVGVVNREGSKPHHYSSARKLIRWIFFRTQRE